MESKHTPGPWVAEDEGEEHEYYSRFFRIRQPGPTGEQVGLVWTNDHTPADAAQAVADARLIAAAPDLLAACLWMLHAIKMMRKPGWDDGECLANLAKMMRDGQGPPALEAAIRKATGAEA